MIQIENRFNKKKIEKEELEKFCRISKTNEHDIFEIAKILCYNMGLNNPIMALQQLLNTNVNVNESIKLYDPRDNSVYGVLILSNFPMEKGSPLSIIEPKAAKLLKNYSQINGFLFIIDERLRGSGFDKKMIEMALPYISQFDMIWVGVDKNLKTHNYWQRLGLVKTLTTNEAVFYTRFINKKCLEDIYNKMIE